MPENFATFISTHQWILLLAATWVLPWKGVALWRAARNQSIAWFVILLIANTLGILDIIYIFAFSKKTGVEILPPAEAQKTQIPEKIALDIKTETKSDIDEKSKEV